MLWNTEFQQINENIFVAADGKEYDLEKIHIATARGYISCVCPNRFTGSECTDCAVGYTGSNCATCSNGYTATSYDDDGIPECAGIFLYYIYVHAIFQGNFSPRHWQTDKTAEVSIINIIIGKSTIQ